MSRKGLIALVIANNVAGLGIRLAALLVDILMGLMIATSLNIILPNVTISFIFAAMIILLYLFLLPIFCEGCTVGKYLLDIPIKRMDGKQIGIGTMFLRVVITPILYGITLFILLIVSVVMICKRKDKRSIHDLIAGTYVEILDSREMNRN